MRLCLVIFDMIDLGYVRKNPEEFNKKMEYRGDKIRAEDLLNIDEKKRSIMTEIQDLRHKKKIIVKDIAKKRSAAEDIQELSDISNDIQRDIDKKEEECNGYSVKLQSILESIPNIIYDDIPIGTDEHDNTEIKRVLDIPMFDFEIKSHEELGVSNNIMDFHKTVDISGARFMSLKGDLAQMERALISFMLDINKNYGYTEISHPVLVLDKAMYGTGQLPKFAEDSFETTNGMRLIPTSEVFLTNLVRDTVMPVENLPLRYTACSDCFRSEAGSAGRDTKGMMRLHQFKKVELVSIVTEEESYNELERMLSIIENILQDLELPYKIMELCSGDIGFSAAKTYDLEVWVPSQNKYREISSCSNCTDFQGRRMMSRYKTPDNKKHYVHTLNGSSLAIGRTILAILENYQQEDSSILIPNVLRKYFDGKAKLEMG